MNIILLSILVYLSGLIVSILAMKLVNKICPQKFRRGDLVTSLLSWLCLATIIIEVVLDNDIRNDILKLKMFNKLGDWLEK